MACFLVTRVMVPHGVVMLMAGSLLMRMTNPRSRRHFSGRKSRRQSVTSHRRHRLALQGQSQDDQHREKAVQSFPSGGPSHAG